MTAFTTSEGTYNIVTTNSPQPSVETYEMRLDGRYSSTQVERR